MLNEPLVHNRYLFILFQPLYGGGDDHDVVSWGAFAQYMKDFDKVYADRKGSISVCAVSTLRLLYCNIFFLHFKTYNMNVFLIEMKNRFKIFQTNMLKAKRLTEKELGTAVYGPNEFSDMSGNTQ